jgi:hypothetical protein
MGGVMLPPLKIQEPEESTRTIAISAKESSARNEWKLNLLLGIVSATFLTIVGGAGWALNRVESLGAEAARAAESTAMRISIEEGQRNMHRMEALIPEASRETLKQYQAELGQRFASQKNPDVITQ